MLSQKNLASELVEDLGDAEQVLVDRVRKVDEQVRAMFNSTRHIEASSGHDLCLTTLRHRVMAGNLVVTEAQLLNVLGNAESPAHGFDHPPNVVQPLLLLIRHVEVFAVVAQTRLRGLFGHVCADHGRASVSTALKQLVFDHGVGDNLCMKLAHGKAFVRFDGDVVAVAALFAKVALGSILRHL